MIVVVAHNYRAAKRWAGGEGLAPHEWVWPTRAGHLYGLAQDSRVVVVDGSSDGVSDEVWAQIEAAFDVDKIERVTI